MSTIDPNTPIGNLAQSKSKYMKKEDVGREGRVLTIKGFRVETIEGRDGDDPEEKTIVYFREADVKPMVLNKTNAEMLALCTGAKTAGEAVGKKVRVYEDPTIMFGGKRVGGLRIGDAQYPGGGAGFPKREPQRDVDDVDPDEGRGENDIPF